MKRAAENPVRNKKLNDISDFLSQEFTGTFSRESIQRLVGDTAAAFENASISHYVRMTAVRVFDPTMCCSTGVCSSSIDADLARFAADRDSFKSKGVAVERFNLSQHQGMHGYL